MAKNKKNNKYVKDNLYTEPQEMPNVPFRGGHGAERAINRKEAREVYAGYEMKNDYTDQYRYDQIKAMESSFYGGIDPRRRWEMANGGMVAEDRNAFANLSAEPIHREYPRAGFYHSPYIDDSTKE